MHTEYSLTTKEFAGLYRVQPQSVLHSLCVNGHYLNIKPIKLPNGRNLWPKPESLTATNPKA